VGQESVVTVSTSLVEIDNFERLLEKTILWLSYVNTILLITVVNTQPKEQLTIVCHNNVIVYAMFL
jgi:hypothetical protein